MPSSMTRFVLAISKAIAEVKLPPLRNMERLSATAAYEHDDEAAPSKLALTSVLGLSSGSSLLICLCDTTAWIAPLRPKPRISGQRISQAILKEVEKA